MLASDFFLIVLAYLLGALPFALLIARLFKLPDPRSYGSGNLGATNVARSGNKIAAILTLFADSGKGIAAISLAQYADMPPAIIGGAGVAVVVGHVFPVFLRFRGGRGVATGLGVFLAWHPLIGAGALLIWVGVFAVCRYSSAASLLAMSIAAAVTAFYLPLGIGVAAVGIAVIVCLKHRDNITRLIRREESRF